MLTNFIIFTVFLQFLFQVSDSFRQDMQKTAAGFNKVGKSLYYFNRMGNKLNTNMQQRSSAGSGVSASNNVESIAISSSSSKGSLQDKSMGALYAFYCGDSLAMPVHWYYNIDQLKRDFGSITKYEAPKTQFKGSIMNLSNTGGGGRGDDKGNIVGDVILHGKKQFWLKGGNFHYHHGMLAGQNTLDALVTNVLIKSMIERQTFVADDFRAKYIAFMTTPGSHNDTYAGTCHRMFFKNMIAGKALEDCPDNDGHNVDAIDALMIVPPIALANANASPAELQEKIVQGIHVTRKSTVVMSFAFAYAEMLISVAKGESTIREAAVRASIRLGSGPNDLAQMVTRSYPKDENPMTACYITSSFPALLVFAYKYSDSPEEMLFKSANAGGENVARGSLLGALAGAAIGYQGISEPLRSGLFSGKEYEKDISTFVEMYIK